MQINLLKEEHRSIIHYKIFEKSSEIIYSHPDKEKISIFNMKFLKL